MIAILIALLLSYFLLRYTKNDFSVLGLTPSLQRIYYFLMGLIVAVAFMFALKFAIAYAVQNPYLVNKDYQLNSFFSALWYVVKGVVLEELVFRGAIFYLLIQKIGFKRAIWISAFAFGMYHWFSYGIIGQPIQMLIVLAMTGSVGYVLGFAYHRSKTLYLPIALHLGYNVANMIVFSAEENIGAQLLEKKYLTDPIEPSAWLGLPLILLYYVGFQLICYFLIKSIKEPLATNAQT